MKALSRLLNNLKQNFAEYYTLLVVVIAIPAVIGLLFGSIYGFGASFVFQAIIGILYIRASN